MLVEVMLSFEGYYSRYFVANDAFRIYLCPYVLKNCLFKDISLFAEVFPQLT
jgi:hypothetical protein